MSKDTSSLYSGTTSNSLASKVSEVITKGKEKEKQARSEAKKQESAVLRPAAELLTKIIEDEQEKIFSIRNIDPAQSPDDRTFYTEVLARRRYDLFLTNLKKRVNATPEVTQGESFDE